MGIFNTRPRFDDVQIKQLSGDTITLSGTTNISGTFRYLPGATTGYVLKAIDSSGTVGWQPVSVSADTNTFVTGGTLNGSNQLILNWNTGGSASAIDLSALSDTTYWTAGTSGTGSIRVVNGGTTDATGTYSVAQGLNTTASGDYGSHSEGRQTTASGPSSHAEGYLTTAFNEGSHAEGGSTFAQGPFSHAEGNLTTASGGRSHAEGYLTTASGAYSHSEGRQTTASGDYSHAEGYQSTASGILSHAEGSGIASGTLSHAEGGATVASGSSSHSEGSGTIASGDYSHSEGENTIASGDRSHAEGFETTASGLASHSEGYQTIASGTYSHAGGQGSIVSGTDSFIHSTNSLINGARSVLLGGQNLTGTTSDTVYVPNLTVREDYILHSDSTLEVSDIPGTLENIIKGSYTEFNWDGLTTSVLSNNNPSGYTSVILGNLTTYPTREDYGFLSYYGSGYTRTGSPGTGIDFYRDRLVLKSSSNSDGVIFSNNGPKKFWWEIDSKSRMILDDQGQLGLGLNVDGSQNPSEMLHIDGGNLLVRDSQGIFITDIENSAGPLVKLTGGTTDLPRFGVVVPTYDSITIGIRGGSEPTSSGYGKQGDAFIYSSTQNNGFNIVSEPGSGTDDYIRFFAGQAGGAANTPDLYIQGSGTTGSVVRGNIGINNDTPTSKLDIIGTNGYNQLRLRTNYTPTSTADTNGAVGDIAWDNNYLYIKTGTGWGRLSLDYAF